MAHEAVLPMETLGPRAHGRSFSPCAFQLILGIVMVCASGLYV